MKSNVDLTDNMMFSRRRSSSTKWVRFVSRARLNMRIIHSKSDIREEHLLLTGNRIERRNKKLTNEELSREFCDRCGVSLKRFPWRNDVGLCSKCNTELNKELGINRRVGFRRINESMTADRTKNPFRT